MPDTASPAWLPERLADAVALAVAEVRSGGIPFSGLVVDGTGTVLGSGVNRVRAHQDPTAHAEIVALRDAARRHGPHALAGTTLIASGEPCPLCYVTALWSGVGRVVFAADRHAAAAAGFDYVSSYDIFAVPVEQWRLSPLHVPVENAREPFRAWLDRRQESS
ncbi:nucleoside deaminase [Nonomuraea roseoviolacea subsp. roseoviolacea]|uniref:tRNA(Arg) A34 adenosine deaminase TadA n=1 Tax=Nonomuraea roseoviolacea subsp. carminata TaxID=160689 RepID=A0ABT1JVR0_9ACTN|nr:nucleoside deaminase [Nonomuraea roseoviolacea]MCP2345412.1 tRNA(Arg) A34 adenosine deaminase TadA [Nonomuraea roseoviolacea subsp. carminata]